MKQKRACENDGDYSAQQDVLVAIPAFNGDMPLKGLLSFSFEHFGTHFSVFQLNRFRRLRDL